MDSRSSINPYILNRVQGILSEFSSECSHVYILGGNHDYYSPVEKAYNITSLDLLSLPANVQIVAQDSLRVGDVEFVPYFKFHNRESLQEIIDSNPNIIYTHTDLGHLYPDIVNIVNSYPGTIYSGHIHTPNFTNPKRLILGSCFALTYADANQDRYYYTIEDDDPKTLIRYGMADIRRFWRIYESTLENDFVINEDDFVEVYVTMDAFKTNRDRIAEYKTMYNANVIIIPTNQVTDTVNIQSFDDLDQVIEQYIPDHLRKKFNTIREYQELETE